MDKTSIINTKVFDMAYSRGFNGEYVSDDDRLNEDLYLDSLDQVELIMSIETALGYTPDYKQLYNVNTVKDVYELFSV